MSNYKKEEVIKYRAICSSCHQHCEVPFKPDANKPVFCDKCFQAARVTSNNDYVKRKDKMIFDKDDSSKDFVSTYSSEVVATPTDAKIIELKREINSVNAKLDKVIDILNKLSPKKIEKKDDTII